MAGDPLLAASAPAPGNAKAAATATAMQAVQKVEPLSAAPASPTDLVAAAVAAASTAAAAASTAASGLYTAAGSFAGPVANNITNFTATLPVRSVATQLQSAAVAGHSTAAATVGTLSAALEAYWSGGDRRGKALASTLQVWSRGLGL